MDGVLLNHVSEIGEIQIVPTMDNNPTVEMYTEIISCQETVFDNSLKNDINYEIEENDLVMVNDYQSALKCLHLEKDQNKVSHVTKNYENGKNFNTLNTVVLAASDSDSLVEECQQTVKTEHIHCFKATDDESMAIEALRQLGGMYNSVVTTEQVLPLLPCNLCDQKFRTTSDLHAHFAICKNQIIHSYTCPACREVFDSKIDFTGHGCYIQETYSCRFCSQNFYVKHDLHVHMNTVHQGERPYKCHVCDLGFPRPSSLTNHLKIHKYQPGRAIFGVTLNEQDDSPTESNTWGSDNLVYVPDKSCTDSLSPWTFNYGTANCLVQTELNSDINLSVGQEMVVNTSYVDESSDHSHLECAGNSIDKTQNSQYQYQNDTSYIVPIKLEAVSYLTDVEKMDENFPISSIPQMEVTIDTVEKKPNCCLHCGETFSRAKALASHMRLHMIGWSNSYECESCGETFASEKLQSDHKENCVISNTLLSATPICQKNVGNLQNNHSDINGSLKKIQNESKKNNGLKPMVKVGKHPCPDCDKRFTTKQKMYRHMWIHRKKTFSCEMCALTFEIQAELDKHRLSQHPTDSPYVCQECGKCFASRQGLWEHGRVHGGGNAGLFNCTQCTKTFASRQGFLIHNRTHTGERPYGCRFCLKAFRDGGTLRKHERIHTGERPHVCPICLHDFNQKVVLREHVRWVHVASKVENESGFFICQICTVNISDKEELCAHIVKHSDQMAAEAKDAAKIGNTTVKTTKKSGKKVVSKKKSVTAKSNVMSEEKQAGFVVCDTILTKCEPVLTQYEYSPDESSVECDMCGISFPSQKELMTHVNIHI